MGLGKANGLFSLVTHFGIYAMKIVCDDGNVVRCGYHGCTLRAEISPFFLAEPLLCNIVGEAVGDRDDDPLMQYYIKVMRLFEQVSAPDMVVAVATEASKLGKGDCPSTVSRLTPIHSVCDVLGGGRDIKAMEGEG